MLLYETHENQEFKASENGSMGSVTCRHGRQRSFNPRSCRVEEKDRQLEVVFRLSVHAQIHKVNKCLKCNLKKVITLKFRALIFTYNGHLDTSETSSK